MREVKYLSPTSIQVWERDRREFYLQYLADNRPPRMPQNKAMAIGAAFDAYIKAYLTSALFGKESKDTFDLTNLFEAQVEKHNRTWAWEHGKYAFETYKSSGALADLMLELQGSTDTPRFEMTIENRVAHSLVAGGVPFLGKPDIYYTKRGSQQKIIHDWKVNGYMSAKTTSPKKGYVELYDAGVRRGFHAKAMPMMVDGLYVNVGSPLESVDLGWATQTAIYAWILGEGVGSKFLVGIHQLCCRAGDPEGVTKPVIRVAAHRNYISPAFQESLMARCAEIWRRIEKGLIFDQDNEETCVALDQYYKIYENTDNNPDSDWFNEVTR